MGRDKATLPMPGSGGDTTLIEHVVGVIARRCAPVFVVAARGQRLPKLPAQVLRDEFVGAGPLPATGAGLRAAAATGTSWALVCAVDMPLLNAELIETLATATGADADIVVPYDGRDHYLAAMYHTGLAGLVTRLTTAGERRMGALIDAAATRRLVLPETAALTNVNSPADLRAVVQRRVR